MTKEELKRANEIQLEIEVYKREINLLKEPLDAATLVCASCTIGFDENHKMDRRYKTMHQMFLKEAEVMKERYVNSMQDHILVLNAEFDNL